LLTDLAVGVTPPYVARHRCCGTAATNGR